MNTTNFEGQLQIDETNKGSEHNSLEIDIQSLPSPALDRLIEEVRNDPDVIRSYNRVHNRHNR